MNKKDKKKIKDNVKKTAKGFEIIWTVGWVLFGIAFLGLLIYIGVVVWNGIFPYWGK